MHFVIVLTLNVIHGGNVSPDGNHWIGRFVRLSPWVELDDVAYLA